MEKKKVFLCNVIITEPVKTQLTPRLLVNLPQGKGEITRLHRQRKSKLRLLREAPKKLQECSGHSI